MHSSVSVCWGCNHSLVCTDTCCFQRFRAQLLVFIRYKMDAKRELIDICTFAAKVEDSDFRIRNTTVEAGFRIWLLLANVSKKLEDTEL
jgi:hypothetical protein